MKALSGISSIARTAISLLALQKQDSEISSYSSGSDMIKFVKSQYEKLNTSPAVKLKYSEQVSFSFEAGTQNFNNFTFTGSMSDEHDRKQVIETVRQSHNATKPVVVYFPGLDGQGISSMQQHEDLADTFEFWRMTLNGEDCEGSFTDMISAASVFLDEVLNNGDQKAIVIGESFGGLVAPSVSLRNPNLVSGMVLVNPATSYEDTNWSSLGPFLTSLGSFNSSQKSSFPSLYSVVGGITLSLLIPDFKQVQDIVSLLTNITVSNLEQSQELLTAMADGFGILEDRLPPQTLKHRVTQLLPVGSAYVNSRLDQIDCPSLVIVGSDDNMLPSKKEGNRLKSILKHVTIKEISGSGHFILDDRVNLTEMILNSPLRPFPKEKYDPILDWKAPTEEEIKEVNENQVNLQRTLVSPVFLSTDSSGTRRKGISAVPNNNDGPILFVANHQFGGQDLGMIISELLIERNLPVRGLAHPVIFASGENGGGRGFGGGESPNGSPRSQFETFGAVKVTPKNYYRLMQTGQAALLFPGGVKEVFHGKNEAYQLLWPDKTDFVRTAAKFNATIIPLSAIGAADSVNILIDAPDMLNLPFGLGERLANQSSAITAARFDTSDDMELFTPPFALPKPLPDRHYFLFGKPIDTANIDYRNKSKCDVVYKEVQAEMNRGFRDLLRARESDSYRDSPKRLAYERLTGKTAPTFELEKLVQEQ